MASQNLLFMPDFLVSIFRVALVGIILIGMIMILLGIIHLTHNDDSLTDEETQSYRQDIPTEKRVISSKSVFNNFLARSMKRAVRKKS